MVIVKAAGYTDIGKIRKTNQDALIVSNEKQLYIVADGMGGHKAGDVASRMTVAAIESSLKSPGSQSEKIPAASILKNSIRFANQKVFERSSQDQACSGMGSTVSIVYFCGSMFAAANVGDSPIYMIRNKAIQTLSTPHTLLYEQAAANNKFTPSKDINLGHILTRAIGIKKVIEPDICEFPCQDNDIYIICSDGLSGKVSRDEILDSTINIEPEEACARLIDLANNRGGEDNITIVVIKVIAVNTEQKNRKKNIFAKLRELFTPAAHG